MLKRLKTSGVGPATELEAEFGKRLTLITGDNGLGKSFLLDVAWWGLTGIWPAHANPDMTGGAMARPRAGADARIDIATAWQRSNVEPYERSFRFEHRIQRWWSGGESQFESDLVLYAMADGAFAVFDPVRNDRAAAAAATTFNELPVGVGSGTATAASARFGPRAYVFSPRQVWDGLPNEQGGLYCNGLLADWANWQREMGADFRQLADAIADISPSTDEQLTVGDLTRVSLGDVRDIPTVKMPTGDEVPVLFASSAVRRMLVTTYLLVWAWREHRMAATLTRQTPANQLVLLVDEVETHLHPRWQRTVLPALLQVARRLLGDTVQVQLIVTTHSPLVMASAEPLFDAACDAWLDFDVERRDDRSVVTLERRDLVPVGDASRWLLSDAFHLTSTASMQAEAAMEEATALAKRSAVSRAEVAAVEKKLRAVLSDVDPFWIRWVHTAEKRGWRATEMVAEPRPRRKRS